MFSKLDLLKINHLVFWTAVTLVFRCLLRASNYCSSRHSIKVRDLVFVSNGIVVKIPSSKTNQFNEYVSQIPLYGNPNSVLCPFNWLNEMLSLRKPGRDDNLFMLFIRGEWRPMRASWFNNMIKSVCNVPKASSHSLRRGGASFMLQNRYWCSNLRKDFFHAHCEQL